MLTTFYQSYGQEDVLWPNRKKAKPESGRNDCDYTFILGAEIGLNFNFFNQNLAWTNYYNSFGFANPTAYDSHTSGFGLSPHFGLLADFPLGKGFNLQIRFDADERSFGNSGSGFDYAWDATAGAYRQKSLSLKWDVTAFYTGVDLLLRYDIDDKLFVSGGFIFQYLMNSVRLTQTPTTDGSTLLNDFDYWRLYSGGTGNSVSATYWEDDPFPQYSRTGLEFGVGYKIPLSCKIWLVPQGRLQYFFDPVVKNSVLYFLDTNGNRYDVRASSNSQLWALQFSLGLWFGI